jgi:hypothetical protein
MINEVGIDTTEDSYHSGQEAEDNNQSLKNNAEEASDQQDTDQFVLAMDQKIDFNDYDPTGPIDKYFYGYEIECEPLEEYYIAEIQAESHQPQTWNNICHSSHVEDARLMRCKPNKGKAHLIGFQAITPFLINNHEYSCLLDSGASCSIISNQLLNKISSDWEFSLIPITHARFHSCSDQLRALGIIELALIFPHTRGSVRIVAEFVVMENARMN